MKKLITLTWVLLSLFTGNIIWMVYAVATSPHRVSLLVCVVLLALIIMLAIKLAKKPDEYS